AADYAVIDDEAALAFEFGGDWEELATNGFLPRLLTVQNEGAINVSILDQKFAKRQTECLRQGYCRNATCFWHRYDDVCFNSFIENAIGQKKSQAETCIVDSCSAHLRFDAGKIDPFEHARRKLL